MPAGRQSLLPPLQYPVLLGDGSNVFGELAATELERPLAWIGREALTFRDLRECAARAIALREVPRAPKTPSFKNAAASAPREPDQLCGRGRGEMAKDGNKISLACCGELDRPGSPK
jgi:hypothetical protein